MQAAPQTKSKTTVTPLITTASQPFFKKTGDDDFFVPARPTVVPAIKATASNAVNRPGGKPGSTLPPAGEGNRQTKEQAPPAGDRESESRQTPETQAPEAGHDGSAEQNSVADHTAGTSHAPQPVTGDTDSEPGASGPPENRQDSEGETIAGPESKASPEALAGGRGANDSDISAVSGRIASAPQSPAKAQAEAQAHIITADSIRSEAQVTQISSARRAQTGIYFSDARFRLASFFISSIIGVQRLIAARQGEITSAVSRALVWAQTAVIGIMHAAQALSVQIRTRINQILTGITAAVQGRVQGIASGITALINSVPLPDIPGIGRIRSMAVNMLNRAAGIVNGAFGRFTSFIRWGLNTGMNVLDLLLAGFTRVVGMVMSRVSSAILSVLHLIFQALNRVASRIASSLYLVLSMVFRIINPIERFINRLITTAEKTALALLRLNRRKSLDSLAEAVSGPVDRPGESQIDRIRQIVRDALLFNRLIVQTITLSAAAIIAALVRIISSIVLRVITMIAGMIAQAIHRIAAAFIQVIQLLGRIIQIIGSFLQEMFSRLAQAINSFVSALFSMIQRGMERIIRFAQNALQRVTGFIMRFVRNLILGRGFSESLRDALEEFVISHGPITRPRPGPITIPAVLLGIVVILATIGALIVYAFPELVVVIAWLVSLGLSPMAAFAVFAVAAILLLLLLLLLLMLLIKWLTRPKPSPPEPSITHETVFSAPDGSPKTRNKVGVGEKVDFKGTPPGRWTANSGAPVSASGPAFTWTAPDRGASAAISLTASGKSATVNLDVEEPNGITADKLSENTYPAGSQGAGMLLDFIYNPLRVSFGNTEAREVSGPASNITGYYLIHGMPHYHNAGSGSFFRITQGNRLQPPVRDRASQSGYPSPWSDGGFEWLIPNKFKVITEGGDGKQFTTVTQAFKIEGPSGKTTITKAGAKVERTP